MVLLYDSFHLDAKVISQKLHGTRLRGDPFQRSLDGDFMHAEFVRNLCIAQSLFQALSLKDINFVHVFPPSSQVVMT